MKRITEWTVNEVKEYETREFVKAMYDGDNGAWKTYRKNVKRVVIIWNKAHDEQINIDALMA